LDVALSLEVNINKAKKHEFMKADSKETSSSNSPKVDPSLPKVSFPVSFLFSVSDRIAVRRFLPCLYVGFLVFD
jgi:hypothetical protein